MSENTQESIEALIDEAGRDAVFARADVLGWTGRIPPMWVWAGICHEILQERARSQKQAEGSRP